MTVRILLDTHIVVWAMVGSEKLSGKAKALLADEESELYVSSASVWEVAIKHDKRPEQIPVTAEQVDRYCRECGIRQLPVRFRHALKVAGLEKIHEDPFDRILVAQAMDESMKLVSHDHRLPPYGDFVIEV